MITFVTPAQDKPSSSQMNHNNHSPAPIPPPVKPRFKPYSVGITAGAEDEKYHTKYAQLKKKVRDIEADNDKLHYKILQARRSLQRMKLQRALLYERMSISPPSPTLHDRQHLPLLPNQEPYHLPVFDHGGGQMKVHDGLGSHPHYDLPPPRGKPMTAPAPAGRHLPSLPPLQGQYHRAPPSPPPPQRKARTSSSKLPHASPPHHQESPRSYPRAPAPPLMPPRHHSPPHSYDPGPPPFQQSPPLSERERPRNHDPTDFSPRLRTSETRSSDLHNHQRLGPGTYINRDERDRVERHEREWARDRDPVRSSRYDNSRPLHFPPLSHPDYRDQHLPPPSRIRDDPGYYHDGPPGVGAAYGRLDRSETPGSGSGGSGMAGPDMSSRSDSRDIYEQDRRGYRLRPVTGPDADREYPPPLDHSRSHSHSRSLSRDHSGSAPGGGVYSSEQGPRIPSDSRKRMHSDMDVDVEPDAADAMGSGGSGPMAYPGHSPHDRGTKRYQREPLHRDGQEEERTGS